MAMSDSSWSSYLLSQYEDFVSEYDDTLNDTEEVGNVLVDNITISHFRQYSFFFMNNFMHYKNHSRME